MIPERFRILMNNELDGTNTPAERDELETYFDAHPQAKQYLTNLSESLHLLDSLEQEDPPAELHGRVMRAVRATEGRARAPWRDFLFGRLRLGYAFSAAVGVVLGFLLHTAIPLDSMGRDLADLDLMRGTATGLIGNWSAAQTLDLHEAGVDLTVKAYRQADMVLVRVTLSADQAVSLGLDFPGASQLKSANYEVNEGFDLAAGEGLAVFKGQGDCFCDFLMDGVDARPVGAYLQFGLDATQRREYQIIWP